MARSHRVSGFLSHHTRGGSRVGFCLCLLAGMFSALGQGIGYVSYALGIPMDSLTISSQTFTNVIVYSRDSQYIFFEHASGVGSATVSELDPAALQRLGLSVDPPKQNAGAVARSFLRPSFRLRDIGQLSSIGLTSLIVMLILAVGLYLYCSFLFWLICVKVGAEPGISVWLPVVQVIPLLRAAGMSVLWPIFLLLLLVFSFAFRAFLGQHAWAMGISGASAGFIFFLTWSFKICSARKKSPLLAAFMVVPGVNFFALLYLAGSK